MRLTSQEISELLPHRYPFLLVDRVLELEPGKYCRAIKNVTVNEPFFPGHFPGVPTMPGVLILESQAQAGALILMSLKGEGDQIVYLAGLDKVRFKKPVVPGDTMIHDVTLVWHRRGFGKIQCVTSVGEEVVAESEISYSFLSQEQ